MAVAEAWVGSPTRLARYVRPEHLHQAFNFEFVRCEWDATDFREAVDRSLSALRDVGASAQWVLSNHDVTRHVTRFGGGERGVRRARAAALMVLALPGGAYVYQGEELALPEIEDLPEEVLADPVWERSGHTERGRDGCRVPIPWERDGPSYGFGPDGSWLPQPPSWSGLSVQAQLGVTGSTLELYRSALAVRRLHPALGEGAMEWLGVASASVLALRREPGFVCVVNFGAEPAELPEHEKVLLASEPLGADGRLPADTAVWLQTS
jgi:alpha-glucosidase